MVIDSHCHLHDPAFADVTDMLRVALAHDVYGVVGVGCDATTNAQTMAATLKRMERDGLLVRRPDPTDGRGTLYRLSGRGMEMTGKVRAFGQSINAAALEGLTDKESAAMLAALSKVIGNLERWIAQNR